MVALNNYVKDIQINTTKQHVNLYEEEKKASSILMCTQVSMKLGTQFQLILERCSITSGGMC